MISLEKLLNNSKLFIIMDYDSTARSYEGLHKEEQLNKIRIICSEIKPGSSDKLLNIGCGPYFSSPFFNCKKYGIDPSEELLAMAKDAEVKVGMAEDLPYVDNFFDYVISISALHHAEIDKALAEIKRVAKKEARIVLSILRKSAKHDEFVAAIQKIFSIEKIVEEEKDTILFCCFN